MGEGGLIPKAECPGITQMLNLCRSQQTLTYLLAHSPLTQWEKETLSSWVEHGKKH